MKARSWVSLTLQAECILQRWLRPSGDFQLHQDNMEGTLRLDLILCSRSQHLGKIQTSDPVVGKAHGPLKPREQGLSCQNFPPQPQSSILSQDQPTRSSSAYPAQHSKCCHALPVKPFQRPKSYPVRFLTATIPLLRINERPVLTSSSSLAW